MFYKNLFFVCYVFFILTIFSCNGDFKNDKSEIILYRRNSGSNNGWITNIDVVAITNYRNKSITIDSLAKIAKNYIDTVKSEYFMSGVTFIGQKPGKHLPSSNPDNYNEFVKYYLIDFGFSNSILDTSAIPKKIELRSIAIWYDQERVPKINLDRMMNAEEASKIDSMLNSKIPFDNGF